MNSLINIYTDFEHKLKSDDPVFQTDTIFVEYKHDWDWFALQAVPYIKDRIRLNIIFRDVFYYDKFLIENPDFRERVVTL